MAKYFIEVAYKGTKYAGFQVQQNANTVQAEVEKALTVYYRQPFALTGSSRTDAGVHAQQNYFHFDTDLTLTAEKTAKAVYHLNAILPDDIVIKSITAVSDQSHCRFDALSRSYTYTLYQKKDPFIEDMAYYYPYAIDRQVLDEVAAMIKEHTSFRSFSKKNTQVFTYECTIIESEWEYAENLLRYKVTGNRFLRGMVRGLVGTMLLAARSKYSAEVFKSILLSDDASRTDFSVPAKGLVLKQVKFPAVII